MRIWNAGSNVYELRIVEILRLTNRIEMRPRIES
jgi:hypothetical protein